MAKKKSYKEILREARKARDKKTKEEVAKNEKSQADTIAELQESLAACQDENRQLKAMLREIEERRRGNRR